MALLSISLSVSLPIALAAKTDPRLAHIKTVYIAADGASLVADCLRAQLTKYVPLQVVDAAEGADAILRVQPTTRFGSNGVQGLPPKSSQGGAEPVAFVGARVSTYAVSRLSVELSSGQRLLGIDASLSPHDFNAREEVRNPPCSLANQLAMGLREEIRKATR